MMRSIRAVVVGLLFAASVCVDAQSGIAGRWQGETGNGRKVVLDLNVKGQQLTGTFTLGQQTVDITEGRVTDKAFSCKITIEGRSPTVSGELVGEQVKLTVEGVRDPLMLARAK
jgi:hypothetical protein